MIENVRKFEKDLRGNEELQKKLFMELAKIAKEESVESDAEAMAKAAQTLGYDFTVADMEKAHAETQELDPEEMEHAAGGWCFADYDCYTAWNHDSPDQPGSACLKDYDCVSVYHNSKIVDYEYKKFVEPVVNIYERMKELIKGFDS